MHNEFAPLWCKLRNVLTEGNDYNVRWWSARLRGTPARERW